MPDRPTVGGSDGTWGTELNAHLAVGHDTDGTHTKSQMLTDMGWSPTTETDDTSSTGVTVFPNGLRIARGVESVSAGAEDTVTPTGFTKIYSVQLAIISDSATDWYAPKLGNVNDSTFTIRNTNTSGLDIYWVAIGR